MVSPHLKKKKEGQLNLNIGAKRLFQLMYVKKNSPKKEIEDSSKINVSAMVSKLSFVYEKIRNAVDYDDDHLLRKNAIKRIFKRQLLIEGLVVKNLKSQELSVHLLTELIRAGYLENNSVAETKIGEIAVILEKYIKLKYYCFKNENLLFSFYGKRKRNKRRTSKAQKKLIDWILTLAAAEIEENLAKDEVEREIVSDMYEILKTNINLPNDLPYKKDLDLQIYLAIARSYLNFDQELLNFIVFKYFNKNWSKIDDQGIMEVAEKIDSLHLVVLDQLKHPLNKQLDKIAKSYSLYFSVLQEVISDNPIRVYDQALNNHKSFINLIKEACEKRFKKIKSRLWRAGFRSIVYIFLTKSIFVFLIEIPSVKWFGEELNVFSLAINVSFPAFLLFVMILFTWAPAKENTKKIIAGVDEVVYNEKRRRNAIVLRKPPKRKFIKDFVFNLLYLIGFSVTIYFIIKFLEFVQFNWVSIIIFLFFLMFVSFFSFRIKRDIKKYIIIEPKENIFTFLFDFLYTPIVAVGKFLSNNASRVNIFVFVLDFIIEAPFKVLVEIFDDWIKYMKERKDNLVN